MQHEGSKPMPQRFPNAPQRSAPNRLRDKGVSLGTGRRAGGENEGGKHAHEGETANG